jgi:hypothetical protein
MVTGSKTESVTVGSLFRGSPISHRALSWCCQRRKRTCNLYWRHKGANLQRVGLKKHTKPDVVRWSDVEQSLLQHRYQLPAAELFAGDQRNVPGLSETQKTYLPHGEVPVQCLNPVMLKVVNTFVPAVVNSTGGLAVTRSNSPTGDKNLLVRSDMCRMESTASTPDTTSSIRTPSARWASTVLR